VKKVLVGESHKRRGGGGEKQAPGKGRVKGESTIEESKGWRRQGKIPRLKAGEAEVPRGGQAARKLGGQKIQKIAGGKLKWCVVILRERRHYEHKKQMKKQNFER